MEIVILLQETLRRLNGSLRACHAAQRCYAEIVLACQDDEEMRESATDTLKYEIEKEKRLLSDIKELNGQILKYSEEN